MALTLKSALHWLLVDDHMKKQHFRRDHILLRWYFNLSTFFRTSHIRWLFVGKCITELFVIAFLLAFLLKELALKPLKDFGREVYTPKDILFVLLKFTVASPLLVFLLFSFVFDCWHNLIAELTTFADRLFYKVCDSFRTSTEFESNYFEDILRPINIIISQIKSPIFQDWWTSTGYLKFFTTWNLVVQDWLYVYVYRDIYSYVMPGSRLVAKIAVLLLSAAIHELIIYVSLRMFYPVLFLLFFGAGTFLTYVKLGDCYCWHALFVFLHCHGFALMIILYTMEYMARNSISSDSGTLLPTSFYAIQMWQSVQTINAKTPIGLFSFTVVN